MRRRRPHPYPGPYEPEPESYRLRSPLPRLAWRYRSELAPLYLALGLLAAGLVLHGWWPGWWRCSWRAGSSSNGTGAVAACRHAVPRRRSNRREFPAGT